ncbi:MAG: hypothetical protein ACLP01_29810 [Solirubrobacteraceae bacterium]
MGENERITGQTQDPAEPAGTAVPDTGSERRDDLFGGETGSSRAEDATRGHGAAPDTGTGAPDEVFGGESGSSSQEDATRGHG